jgi:hypothetical protein
MSSAFAIAAVTAVMKDLLNDGLVNQDLSAIGNVTVTALPPDRIATSNADERSQINLFLYHVTPNSGWRNVGLPSRDVDGGRLSNPPLALDLHYLVTAYGKEEFHAEALLGYAMQLLHENPVLTRAMINRTLKPPLPSDVTLPPGLQMLSTSDLADQVELIKISPQTLSTEEISKLWTATQARYRPTAAYHLSVVLIQDNKPVKTALPVLTRGPQDQGPVAQSDLVPRFPTLESINLPANQLSAQMNDQLTLSGHHLAGDSGLPAQVTLSVLFVTNRLPDPIQVDVPAPQRTDQSVTLSIPHQIGAFYPAGLYVVGLQVAPNGKPEQMQASNGLPLQIAPEILEINATALPLPPNPPLSVARVNLQDGLGEATLTVRCSPEVLPEQNVSLLVGNREIAAALHAAQTDTLTFNLSAFAAGTYRLRFRVDGIDSPLIDRSDPLQPKFDESQKIILT